MSQVSNPYTINSTAKNYVASASVIQNAPTDLSAVNTNPYVFTTKATTYYIELDIFQFPLIGLGNTYASCNFKNTISNKTWCDYRNSGQSDSFQKYYIAVSPNKKYSLYETGIRGAGWIFLTEYSTLPQNASVSVTDK